ncbi:MAG: hypothetical protein IID51_00595 [Proteobacteria bacterium]|nr:hypothetical protein [Pseudomonadota bacterium]
MNRATVRILQSVLLAAGHYQGAIDGLRGLRSNAAVDIMLAARAGPMISQIQPSPKIA